MELNPAQREALLKVKLSALVRDCIGSDLHDSEPSIRGVLATVASGGRSFALTEFGSPSAVAAAILWSLKESSDHLTLFVDFDAGVAARMVSYFTSQGLDASVREVRGSSSVGATPEDAPAPIPTPDVPLELTGLLASKGLEVVSEHGVVRGEVLGLEVARLVKWPSETGGDDLYHLEVGVGRFDRDAVWAVNDGTNMESALGQTVSTVRRYRHSGAPTHPLQRLCREKWLRSTLIRDPASVRARELWPVDMTIEQAGLKDAHPAGALGTSPDGAPMVVVASTGMDLATVPLAAELREVHDPSAQLVIAVPDVDAHSSYRRLAGLLDPPAQVTPVPVEWG